MRSKIGIGIPRSQSKMYPVAPASFILLVKRILDILSSSYRLGTLRVHRNCLNNDDAQSGRRMIVQSDIILCDMAIALGRREKTLLQLC
jgi:hypothetical protein